MVNNVGCCCRLSSINFSGDTKSADYLNALRKELAQSRVKNTNSTAMLEYILDFYNQINISNAMTLNSNVYNFSNQINISNAMSKTDQLTGTFLVDTAMVDFSDVGADPSYLLLETGDKLLLETGDRILLDE